MKHSSRTQIPTHIIPPTSTTSKTSTSPCQRSHQACKDKNLTSRFPPRVRLRPSPIDFYPCHQTQPLLVLARPNRLSHHGVLTKVPCHHKRPHTHAATKIKLYKNRHFRYSHHISWCPTSPGTSECRDKHVVCPTPPHLLNPQVLLGSNRKVSRSVFT